MSWRLLFELSWPDSRWLLAISFLAPTIDLIRGKFMTFWGLPQFACYLIVMVGLTVTCIAVCMHGYYLKNVWRK